MPTPQEKITELEAELKQVVEQHESTKALLNNCVQKAVELQGGIAALKSLIEPETEEEVSEPV